MKPETRDAFDQIEQAGWFCAVGQPREEPVPVRLGRRVPGRKAGLVLTPEQFSSAWGPGLVRTEPAALLGVNIPEASRRFLIEAGLPFDAGSGLSFDRPEDEMPTLPEAFPNGYDFPDAYRHFRPIGVDGPTLLCVQEATGHLYCMDIDGQGIPTRFVNSGVPELAEFLLIDRTVPGVEITDEGEDPDEASRDYVARLAAAMRRADPAAMQDGNNYWPIYLAACLI